MRSTKHKRKVERAWSTQWYVIQYVPRYPIRSSFKLFLTFNLPISHRNSLASDVTKPFNHIKFEYDGRVDETLLQLFEAPYLNCNKISIWKEWIARENSTHRTVTLSFFFFSFLFFGRCLRPQEQSVWRYVRKRSNDTLYCVSFTHTHTRTSSPCFLFRQEIHFKQDIHPSIHPYIQFISFHALPADMPYDRFQDKKTNERIKGVQIYRPFGNLPPSFIHSFHLITHKH